MIKLILGGIGSGKSITAVKMIKETEDHCFVNFPVHSDNAERLLISHIIKPSEEKGKKEELNWDFWKEQKDKHHNFHIFIDEIQNIMHARRAMSSFNTVMSIWISQIRKVCGTSEKTHLVCISQELERVDVSIRDLTQVVIYCEKKEQGPKILTKIRDSGHIRAKQIKPIWVILYYFISNEKDNAINYYMAWRDYGIKAYAAKTIYLANPYMQYYDSYALIDFGRTDIL